MFGFVKNTYKQSEAAVVVQVLLEEQRNTGFFYGDPAATATKLVATIWTHKPNMFNGTMGGRPHKASVAALALAYGVTEHSFDDNSRLSFAVSLGNILLELQSNSRRYALNGIDNQILDLSQRAYLEHANRNSLVDSLSG